MAQVVGAWLSVSVVVDGAGFESHTEHIFSGTFNSSICITLREASRYYIPSRAAGGLTLGSQECPCDT